MTSVGRRLREWGGADALRLSASLTALARDAAYARQRALAIEAIARDSAVKWPVRRLAALMLESALTRIRADRKSERRFWIERFGMTDAEELRREGFSAERPIETQLWERFRRLRRVHRLLGADELRDYLRASERECRLTLARYLFTAADVIARIEQQCRRSEGVRDQNDYGEFRRELSYVIGTLPAMERAIVGHLARDSVIRWVSATTPGTIHSLVAQPIGTVVLTIRPPGSNHEIQIKRTGRQRELPYNVVWKREGKVVSPVHHLDGGSEHNSLAYEAEQSSFFSRVFREVHGFDAAMSRPITIARVDTLPTANGDVDLMEYFTAPRVFGERYYEMRWNLYHSVRSLARDDRTVLAAGDDDALSREFIRRTKPAQSILVGNTALRLDRVHRYLGPNGANAYFDDGLGIAHDADDDRRFADELLDEVLGIYDPPRLRWHSYGDYVDAAFRVPKNRARADRVYVSLLEQVGRFWGTLLALRGYTRGESFVERNCGLRSVWNGGEWRVEIVFMDHDSLIFGTKGATIYRPRDPLMGAMADADHILGGVFTAVQRERGEIGCLREAYRIGPQAHRRGMAALRAAMKSAYDRTHDAVRTKQELAALFPAALIPRLGDWDEVVRSYLHAKSPAAREQWPAEVQSMLLARGYDAPAIEEHLQVVPGTEWFLRRIAFLFAPPS